MGEGAAVCNASLSLQHHPQRGTHVCTRARVASVPAEQIRAGQTAGGRVRVRNCCKSGDGQRTSKKKCTCRCRCVVLEALHLKLGDVGGTRHLGRASTAKKMRDTSGSLAEYVEPGLTRGPTNSHTALFTRSLTLQLASGNVGCDIGEDC